jgi:hypothetical protein
MLADVRHASKQLAGKFPKAKAQVALMPRLAEPLRGELVRGMLAGALKLAKLEQATILTSLAHYLSEAEVRGALAALHPLDWPEVARDDTVRPLAEALSALASRLAQLGFAEEALTIVEEIRYGKLRGEAIALVLPHLPEGLPEPLLSSVLAIMRKLPKPKESFWNGWTDAWAGMVSIMETLALEALYPVWNETLHALAERPRPDMLTDLATLSPALIALGGGVAAAEVAHALLDVVQTWS